MCFFYFKKTNKKMQSFQKKFDRIKVVGKKENYLQIVSKDGSVNGYVNKKDAKFIKENENQ